VLRVVAELDLGPEAERRGVDLPKTLSVYNFGFWFDGRRAVLVLSTDPPLLAVVGVEGRARVYGEGLSRGEAEEAVARALGLREEVGEFHSLASRDPLLAAFAREWRGWRLRSTSLWWALVTAVCQQNASFRQGWSMLRRLVRLYSREVELEGFGRTLVPPSPRDVLEDPGKLRQAGLGYRAETVARLARAFVGRSLPPEGELAEVGAAEAEAALRGVKGVGSYTARLALALGLRRYELPPIDRWVRAVAARAYGIEEREVEGLWRAKWGRWGALAVVALTIALDAAPLREALRRVEEGRLLPEPGRLSPATLWQHEG